MEGRDPIVTANYFISIDSEELDRTIENVVAVMEAHGYTPRQPNKLLYNPKMLTFDHVLVDRHSSNDDDNGILDYFSRLGSSSDGSDEDAYLNALKTSRGEHPFEVKVRFRPSTYDDIEGYSVEFISKPAGLLRESRIHDPEEYDQQRAVRESKEVIEDISIDLNLYTVQPPHSQADSFESVLAKEDREILQSLDYGEEVISYSDEGDECLRYDLLHSGLSCYIHAIEWTIIAYLTEDTDIDPIEKQKNEPDTQLNYPMLVQLLEHHADVSQITLEDLESLRTDRYRMAHHREGQLLSSNVETVKERLRILVRTLFDTGVD